MNLDCGETEIAARRASSPVGFGRAKSSVFDELGLQGLDGRGADARLSISEVFLTDFCYRFANCLHYAIQLAWSADSDPHTPLAAWVSR